MYVYVCIYKSRNRASKQVLAQARKSHVCGSGTFGAFVIWRFDCKLTNYNFIQIK